jgi:hypothetical protein
MSTETFVALMTGRQKSDDGVTVDGDGDLAAQVLQNMAVTP